MNKEMEEAWVGHVVGCRTQNFTPSAQKRLQLNLQSLDNRTTRPPFSKESFFSTLP